MQTGDPPFTGAVDIGNAGTLGTAAATVGVSYLGSNTPAAGNTLTLTNSGTITGAVQAFGVGGAITATNSGTIAGGIALQGPGDITLTGSGPIYVAGGGAGSTAVNLSSFRQTSATTGTAGVDALTTTTTTGGLVTATITGPVAIPAAVPQAINLFGVGGARLTLNAVAGNVNVGAGANNFTSTPGGGNTTTAGGTTTTTSAYSQTAIGSAASATLGADARVTGLNVNTNRGAASASVAGQIGSADAAGGVTVSNSGVVTAASSRNTGSATGSTFQSSNSSTAAGGTAALEVAATGRVFGNAGVSSNADAASASVAGAIGTAAAAANLSVNSNGTSTTNTSSGSNNATASSSQSSSSSTAGGGAATVDLAATGRVFGNVSVSSGGGAATATIAGIIGDGTGTAVTTPGNLSVNSNGTTTTTTGSNSNTVASGDFANASQTTRAVTGRAAGATVAGTGAVFGSVSANGNASASVDSAGRIRDNASAISNANIQTAQQSANSRTTTAGSGGASTVVNASSSGFTNTNIGGVAGLQNRVGGVIEDNVTVNGVGGGTLTNAGAIFGNVQLTSTGLVQTSANTSTGTVTTTPATAGGATVRNEQVTTGATSSTPNSGVVIGDYSGTVGATAGSPLAGYRTVTQTGQGGSTATISGTLYADVTTNAGGSSTTGTSSTRTVLIIQPAVAPATPAQESTGVSTGRNATTQLSANNTVTLTGALRNNGTGTGDLVMNTTGGTSTLTATGAIVEGGISVGAGAIASASGTDSSSRATAAATTAGPAVAFIPQSAVSSSFNESRSTAGTSTVTLTRTQVGGGVQVSGRGAGAGSTAAALTVAADSTVGGTINLFGNTAPNARTENSTTDTRTAANAVTRTVRSSTVQTAPTQAGGNVTLTLAGRGTDAAVFSPYGNAAATLSGQLTGGIDVNSGFGLFNQTAEQTFTGTSTTAFVFPTRTGNTQSGSTTTVGGTASLAIASNAALQAAGTSAVAGNVNVSGFGGSTLTIAAGSRVIGGNGGAIFVSYNGSDTTFSNADTFTAGGATGNTGSSTARAVGGAASVTNAGVVGASTGYFGAPVPVTVSSIGGASLANSGTIYGAVSATAIGLDNSNTQTSMGTTDAVTTRTVASNTDTARGGAASVTNGGVVSGQVTVAGATETVTNTGVLRGGVALGQAVAGYTTTTTTTTTATSATSATTVAAAPSARFAQTYTLNQNRLLIGGIQVGGATVADPSTGAATTATLQTGTITSTVNLNGGSVTLGNIAGQVAADGTRLTATTVRMTGDGYLGAGTGDVPTGALGTGSGPLRFAGTPGFGAFVAADPAQGSVSGTTFTPAVTLAGGSRITGATLVEKSGSGSFTMVGTAFRATSNANPVAQYTIDAGTVRVSGGELQLGVAGTDPATGQSVFAIRGNVENTGGTLVLGRRVTDGATTVLQGTSVRIDGNLTQSAAGTISLSANPALVRAAGTAVGALPAEGVLGFGGYGVALTPFVPFDPAATTGLRSTPTSLLVSGNATLAGAVAIATTPGAIYTAGRGADLITVNGTFSQSSLTLAPTASSPFVRFALTPRTVGGTTIVSLDVQRTPYASVATTTNAAAAAAALDTALPNVVEALSAIRNPNGVADVQGYGRLQDLATVIAGLDTQLSAESAAQAFRELGSGSVYGSLAAISTTAAFGDVSDLQPGIDAGVGLWLRPSGQFARFDGDARTGAGRLRADNYGGAIGFSVSTGEGGEVGIGGGYGRIDARDRDFPSTAKADTYMVGGYATQRYDRLSVSAQLVFGWSNWDTTRALPLFARTAAASFDGKEVRADAGVGYDLTFSGVALTPFAAIEARRYSFDAFDEQGAGGIGLAVAGRDRTVVSPELGLRAGGTFGGVSPFVEGSYVFQGDVRGGRNVSYLGDRGTRFRLLGVDPDGYAKLGGGVQADLYGARFFLRGNYLTGGGNETGEVLGGISFRF